MSTPDPALSAVSARVRAILDAAETVATGRGPAPAQASPGARTRPVPGTRSTRPPAAPARAASARSAAAPPAASPSAPAPSAPAPLPRDAASTVLTALPDPTHLLSLVDEVTIQTREVRRRLDALTAAVDRVEARLDIEPGREAAVPSPAPYRAAPVSTASAPPAAAPRSGGADADAPAPRRGGSPGDTVRLVAIEMAVGGATRAEVAERLTGEFGITDVGDVLDAVFGPGSPAESRMPWD